MKRCYTITLTVIIAIVATDAVQFMKVPQMFSHFFQHTQADPDLSFTDFLSQHYSSEPHTDDDDAEDMKLPFKKSEYTAGAISFFFTQKNYVKDGTVIYREAPVSLYRFSCTPAESGNSIWQPPKQA